MVLICSDFYIIENGGSWFNEYYYNQFKKRNSSVYPSRRFDNLGFRDCKEAIV